MDARKSIKEIELPSTCPSGSFIRWIEPQGKENAENYWESYLKGYEIQTGIPRTKNYSDEKKYIQEAVERILGKEETDTLNEIARSNSVALNAVFYGIWGVILQRYNDTEDVVFGAAVSGRPTEAEGINSMPGLFINTVPVRIKAERELRFSELLKKIASNAAASLKYAFYPLADIENKSSLNKNLIDHIVVFENGSADERMGEQGDHSSLGYEIRDIKIFEQTDYDFNLVVIPGETIKIKAIYNAQVYDRAIIEGICKQIENVARNLSENPEKSIKEIEILTEEEKSRLLYEFNSTHTDYTKDKTIHELFEAQADKTPENTAAVYEDKALTYKELNEKANQVARVLREKGAGPDSIIGIMVERSLEMIVGIMGILKAGGAYLPIDAEYPSDRIAYMLKDSGTSILLTQNHLREKTDFLGEIIVLDDAGIYSGESDNLKAVNKSSDRAYVIYTSGSTGKPKGVIIEHAGIINTLEWRINYYSFDEGDTVLQIPSFSFDSSVEDIFVPLLSGGKLVLLSQGNRYDVEYLVSLILKHQVTHFLTVPSFYKVLLEESYMHLNGMRCITIAGESFSKLLVKEHFDKLKHVALYNEYGPTENSVCSTIYQFCEETEAVLIGKPISNASIYIVDQYNNLQPIGVIGEICLSGPGLARGYLNKPDLTEEKFVNHPFKPGARMYRTGDCGRWLPDGNIEFLGRIDHQVKIRGYRIELEEIEEKMRQIEGVKDAAAATFDSGDGQKYICGYVIADKELLVHEIKERLAQVLPQYMIPDRIVFMEGFPLTSNGKLDRKALPIPEKLIHTGMEYEAPTNEIEEVLLTLWENELKVKGIGIKDNFFDLGGHSLKATRLKLKMSKALKVNIPLPAIFENPTVKRLASYISNLGQNSKYSPIPKVENSTGYPLSAAQKRMFILNKMNENDINYNLPLVYRVEGRLDMAKLKNAFEKLINRHESLRTSFMLVEGKPMQIINDDIVLDIEIDEVSEVEEAIKAFVRPFDLTKAPLMRVKVLMLEEEKFLLMMDFHHIISDGISHDIITEELSCYYSGGEADKPHIQYKDYAVWHNEILSGERVKEEEKYWLNRFTGEIPSLCLPFDFVRPKVKRYEGAKTNFRISAEVKNRLNELSRKNNATLFMTLLTAFNILLSKCSGQEDIIVGSPIANRQHPDVETVVGMFVNTIPLRTLVDSEKSFEALLGEVREETLRAYDNQDYPFDALVDKLGIKRVMSRNPIFDVMFVLQDMDLSGMRLGDSNISLYDFDFKVSMFDMTFIAVETEQGIAIDVEYSTNLFREETIRSLCSKFVNLIDTVVQNPERRIMDIEILEEEEKQMLQDFNCIEKPYPSHKVIQQLFEEQVAKYPQKTALVFGEASLTYTALNERANRTANVLRRKGIKQDDIVAVMADRSFEMIIGILGVLKSGAAYLPIDPEYPEERKRYMLEDSQARLLLVSEGILPPAGFESAKVLCLNDAIFSQGDGANVENMNTSRDLAYVIYTSGTTGKPKGVMIEHRGIANFKVFFEQHFNVCCDDRIIQFASTSFDVSVWETFMALLTGAELHIIPKSILSSYRDFENYINATGITIVTLPPPFLANLYPENINTLRMLISAASVVSKEVANKWRDKVEFVNAYGPTEITICAAVWKDNGKLETYPSVPIGRPVFNLKAYVLDKNKKVLPVGAVGELYIAGDMLARGYLNKPELTKEKFVANPFLPGQLMYSTGDLVRWLKDGNLEFLGRTDDQMKIRGFRIEPKEIEDKLLAHDKITGAVVLAKTKGNNPEKFLCAYYTAQSDIPVKDMRHYLASELPDYMIPSYFIRLDEMPLNQSGKVDKNALPEPDMNIQTGTEHIEPRNETEKILADLWKEILTIEKISVMDNFFYLGGNSLLATTLAFRIQKIFGINLPLLAILKNPTIEDIAVEIRSMEKINEIKLKPAGKKEYYKLSPPQKRLYIQQSMDESVTNYNILTALTFKDEINVKKLESAFRELIQRHESLRTSFVYKKDDVYQKVWDNVAFEMAHFDMEEAHPSLKAFDLSKAPLFRVYLAQQEGVIRKIYMEIHHIIFDGISTEIFFRELLCLYRDIALEDVKLQYRDYSEWINSDDGRSLQKEQEKFWMDVFKEGVSVLNLPTDYERKTPMEYTGKILEFEIGREKTEAIKQIAAKHEATLFNIMLAIYNVFLFKITGQENIVVGSPASGRSIPDLGGIIGMFINTLCLSNNVTKGLSFTDLLHNVKKRTIDAFENQEYQYNMLVDKVVGKADYSRNPIFDTMLAVQTKNLYSSEFLDSKITILNDVSSYAMFDLNMQIFDMGDVLPVYWEYRTQLFNDDTVRRFITYFMEIVDAVIENPDIILSEIQISNNAGITNVQIPEIDFTF